MVSLPDPATALSFLPLANLTLPHHAQALSSSQLPPLEGLTTSPQLGVIVRVIPHVAPAAGDAAGREDRLDFGVRGQASPAFPG